MNMGDQAEPYVLIKKNGLAKPFKSISREEFQKFKKMNGLLRDFERTQGILPLVESNASALDNYVFQIEKQDHDLSKKRLEILRLNDEVNRKLLNFLASGRLYLDHTETRLKRSYGMPNVRVTGLSLHESQDVIKNMQSAGASAYLTKNAAFESFNHNSPIRVT